MANDTVTRPPTDMRPRWRVLAAYSLIIAGATVAFAGVVLALVANLPGDGVNEYQRTGNRRDPYPWLGRLAIGMALAWLVWAWLLWRLRPEGWAALPHERWLGRIDRDRLDAIERKRRVMRLAASGVMATIAGVVLAVVTAQVPTPGASGGPDLSFLLMQASAGAMVLGTLAAAASALHPRPADPRPLPPRIRLVAGAGAATAAAALVAAVAVLVVPALAVSLNTSATPAASGPPERRAPVLDGTIAWSVTPAGSSTPEPGDLNAFDLGAASVAELLSFNPSRISLLGTAGGLAALEPRGVRMLDPGTGAVTWSYHRWDARHFGPRHTRDTAHHGTAAVSSDGRWLAMTMFVDAPRSLLIDELRSRTRVWVFDTVSGERILDAPIPDTANIVALADGRVTLTERLEESERHTGTGGRRLAMLRRDGAVAWRQPDQERCWPSQVTAAANSLLALIDCDDQRTLLRRIDSGTGTVDWTWERQHHPERPAISLAVAGRVAVVNVRDGDGNRLVGVQLSTGQPAWERPVLAPDPAAESLDEVGPLRTAADTVVVAGERAGGQGVVLRAYHAGTGDPAWTDEIVDAELPTQWRDRTSRSEALLADGRYLLAYADQAGDGACVLGAWDATTGVRQGTIPLRLGEDRPRCGESSMALLETPATVAAWQFLGRGPWLAVLG